MSFEPSAQTVVQPNTRKRVSSCKFKSDKAAQELTEK